MTNARIDGRRSCIKIDGEEITIQKPGRSLLSPPEISVIKLTKDTHILGKFARLSDGFVSIMEKYPTMNERRRHHPSLDENTVVLPDGFPADSLIAFIQAFWKAKSELPEMIGHVPVVTTRVKKSGRPTGTQWPIDYSSGYLRDYVVIDLETTGLDSRTEKIIEVGAIRYVDDVEIGRFSTLIRPYTNILAQKYSLDEFEQMSGRSGVRYIDDPFITELTGITDEMLCDAPSARQVAPQLFDFIGNLPIVGHNIGRFDLNFLRKLATETKTRTSVGHDFIDTMKMATEFASGTPSRKLEDVGFHLGVYGYLSNHRALDDALYTARVFHEMKAKATPQEIEDYREYSSRNLTAAVIQPNPNIYRINGLLFGQHFVFTGDMAVRRAESMQRVSDLGGIPLNGITKKTNYLVVSERDTETPFAKIQKAQEYIHLGQELEIITESEFYALLAKAAL